jgi:hypothetical protein
MSIANRPDSQARSGRLDVATFVAHAGCFGQKDIMLDPIGFPVGDIAASVRHAPE